MLRQQFDNQKKTQPIEKPIKLPSPITITKKKNTINVLKSSVELGEISKFINEPIAGTPPDKYFMHNLLLRMDKV
jgi:hypothetical protein